MPALINLFYYLDKEHVQEHDLKNFRCQRFCAADRQTGSVLYHMQGTTTLCLE